MKNTYSWQHKCRMNTSFNLWQYMYGICIGMHYHYLLFSNLLSDFTWYLTKKWLYNDIVYHTQLIVALLQYPRRHAHMFSSLCNCFQVFWCWESSCSASETSRDSPGITLEWSCEWVSMCKYFVILPGSDLRHSVWVWFGQSLWPHHSFLLPNQRNTSNEGMRGWYAKRAWGE